MERDEIKDLERGLEAEKRFYRIFKGGSVFLFNMGKVGLVGLAYAGMRTITGGGEDIVNAAHGTIYDINSFRELTDSIAVCGGGVFTSLGFIGAVYPYLISLGKLHDVRKLERELEEANEQIVT